jgi:hypothetical protein
MIARRYPLIANMEKFQIAWLKGIAVIDAHDCGNARVLTCKLPLPILMQSDDLCWGIVGENRA